MAEHTPQADKNRLLQPARDEESAPATRPDQLHPLLRLGQQVGNAQVARMLAQRTAEADEAAVQLSRDPNVQRSPSGEPLEVGMEGGPVSADTAARIQSKRGGGSPLSDSVRQTMESTLGSPLDDVRLHTDAESASLNQRLGAKAFTTGSDIFFGASGSPGDQGLLAHELTHVVQQRSMSGSGPLTVGAAGDQYEQEADRMASRVTGGPAAGDR